MTKPPLKLTSQQNSLFEVLAEKVNNKYYYFPHMYIKLDNNEFQEVTIEELPEGIQKYVKEKLKLG